MSALTVSFKMFTRQIKDDKISAVMIGFPALVAIALYFLAPIISDNLINKYGQEWDLQPFYPMFDAIVIAFSFCMPGFAATMIMLSELDDKVVPSFCASPLGRGGYLFSRLGLPTLFSAALAAMLCLGFNLAGLSAITYGIVILISLVSCMLPSMIVIAFARNKVEGVALFKMSIFTTFAILIPFFVESCVQWVFVLFPSFWIGKMVKHVNYLYIIPAIIISLMWLFPLWKRFMKKI